MVYAVRYGKGRIVATKSGVDAFICQRSNALCSAADVPVGCIRQKVSIHLPRTDSVRVGVLSLWFR